MKAFFGVVAGFIFSSPCKLRPALTRMNTKVVKELHVGVVSIATGASRNRPLKSLLKTIKLKDIRLEPRLLAES